MKGKKEDDDSKPKSANESMQSNQSTDLLIHVELERLAKCSRFQLNPVKGSGVFDGVCYPTIIYMIRPFSEQNLWWFLLFSCTNSYYDDDFYDDFNDDFNDE